MPVTKVTGVASPGGMMRKPLLKLYAPFLAIALIQALFVLIAPSRGDREELTAGPLAGSAVGTDGGSAVDPGTGAAPVDGSTPAAPVDGGGAAAGAPGGTGGGAAGPAGPAPPPGGATGGAAGGRAPAPAAGPGKADSSKCAGRVQQNITYYSPPCTPRLPGSNGGGTYQGVSEKEIKVLLFSEIPNEQVAAILRTQGLSDERKDLNAFAQAAVDFMNKRFEFQGRQIKLSFMEGDCPQTPPNPTKCREAAKKAIAQKPFAVVWNTGLYPTVMDEFARAGIPIIGGWNQEAPQFAGRRPYRWDAFMDGTKVAQATADYYCKKLAGKPASHSGQTIHPTIGVRGAAKRKMGIIVPEDAAFMNNARLLSSLVAKCDPGNTPPIYQYELDINRAAEQTTATTAGLIQNKVTTVVCMCDPIAPVFLTKGLTSQGYFPEHLMSGTSFIDYDLVGRLYDQQQWVHAFGVSLIADFEPFDQQEPSKIWRDTGHQGRLPCQTCGTLWAEFNVLGSIIQGAGQNLNPATLERGAFALPRNPGVKFHPGGGFGQGDYTFLDDVREVYWDQNRPSAVDGRPGSYVSLDNGRRIQVGKFGNDFRIPVFAT